MAKPNLSRRLVFECLESRKVLSALVGGDAYGPRELSFDELRSANGRGGPAAPPIDLATVVLHEIGHALGLDHSTSELCGKSASTQPIMCPYYLGPAFALQPEDISKISALYPNIPNSDTDVVANSLDDRWDDPAISYSFMPDGATIDQGGKNGSNLLATMQAKIGTGWQAIFEEALAKWANATDDVGGHHVLQFSPHTDDGSAFNISGADQGDPRFGDIRFGGHKFDGPGGVLGHTYFPPPNGATAAGDSHYAAEENWKNLSGVSLSAGFVAGGGSGGTSSGGSLGSGQLRGRDTTLALDALAVQAIFAQPNPSLELESDWKSAEGDLAQPIAGMLPSIDEPPVVSRPKLSDLAKADNSSADETSNDDEALCLLLAGATNLGLDGQLPAD